MKTRNILYIIALILVASCKPKVDEFAPSKGNADFSSFIAVGDSWTAGLADASVYKSSQENSFPNILARQFSFVGGGEFKQPLMVDEYGFGLATGTPLPKLVMGYHQDCMDVTGLAPAYADVTVDPANFASVAAQGPFNNISTPGLKTFYMPFAGMANLNPYYGRFASDSLNRILDEIPLVHATFFSLWLGSYDVLGYALGGGNDLTNPLTPVETFTGSLQLTLATLTAEGARGVIANIPDVTDAPYFHTIPYNALPLDQATADLLNMGYASLNQLIKASGSDDTLHFTEGQNALVIQDQSLPWGMRQIRNDELVLLSLPQDSLKCGGWGSQKPIAAKYILDESEIASILQYTDDYNSAISQMADGQNVVLVDMYTVLKNMNGGFVFDGIKVNPAFVTGNFYSTDGLNPCPRGSAVLAYYFIDAINNAFGAQIPQVIVSDYEGVALP